MSPSESTRILVVDDDPEIRALLRTFLEREGFTISEAGDGVELFAALDANRFDLITLDLNLPQADGLTLARRIRARSDVPIVMITGKDDMIDRVVGLELGADDYIVKPFHLREVLARIRAVLRRREASARPPVASASAPSERYRFSDWQLDVPTRQFTKPDGTAVELTAAEFDLLLLLLKRPGRVLSRDVLMDLLKGHDWSPLDRTIDNLIGRVRKKLDDDGGSPRFIKTVRGVGYVFSGTVQKG